MPLPLLQLTPPTVHPVEVSAVPQDPPLHWLGLTTITYKVPDASVDGQKDKLRTYEAVYRTRHGFAAPGVAKDAPKVDANDIVAVTTCKRDPSLDARLVVVMQYRPAVAKHTLEFPAGCIDPHESDFISSALRELREETGLVGTNPRRAFTFTYEPGVSRSCGHAIACDVDLDDVQGNGDPQPHLEDGEFSLRTFMLPMRGLYKTLTEFAEKHSDKVILDSRLAAFALGLEYADRARPEASD